MDIYQNIYQKRCVSFSSASFPSILIVVCQIPVTLGGAILFLVFGVIYLYEALYYTPEDVPAALPYL